LQVTPWRCDRKPSHGAEKDALVQLRSPPPGSERDPWRWERHRSSSGSAAAEAVQRRRKAKAASVEVEEGKMEVSVEEVTEDHHKR
jgi:hypothetical protein